MYRQTLGCLIVVSLTLLPGCATKKYVRAEIETAEGRQIERVDGVETQVEEIQTRLVEQEKEIEAISGTAREALERAIAAGKLAEGRFLYEAVFSSEKIGFDFDRAELQADGMTALDGFATELKERDEDVFIEIQGHTDSVGSDDYNIQLGEERAKAVRRYLNGEHGLPLHRMSVISYGEAVPVAGNDSREDRALNRRVALVVLK